MKSHLKNMDGKRKGFVRFILLAMILATVFIMGCTEGPNTKDSDTESSDVSRSASNANYEWVVEPKFDYSRVSWAGSDYCARVNEEDNDYKIINPKTGELTGEIVPSTGGGYGGIAYDEDKKIWGLLSEYNDLNTYSGLAEALQQNPSGELNFGEFFFVLEVKLSSSNIGAMFEPIGRPNPNTYESGRYALANKKGLLTEFIYDGIDEKVLPIRKTPAVMQGNKWGFINEKGELMIPYEFDGALSIDDETAFVKKNGKWGIIRKKV